MEFGPFFKEFRIWIKIEQFWSDFWVSNGFLRPNGMEIEDGVQINLAVRGSILKELSGTVAIESRGALIRVLE